MTTQQIEAYLSAALDQEACKSTLTDALVSRIVALRKKEIALLTLIGCLENMCEQPGQLNSDVIENVVDLILDRMAGEKP